MIFLHIYIFDASCILKTNIFIFNNTLGLKNFWLMLLLNKYILAFINLDYRLKLFEKNF